MNAQNPIRPPWERRPAAPMSSPPPEAEIMAPPAYHEPPAFVPPPRVVEAPSAVEPMPDVAAEKCGGYMLMLILVGMATYGYRQGYGLVDGFFILSGILVAAWLPALIAERKAKSAANWAAVGIVLVPCYIIAFGLYWMDGYIGWDGLPEYKIAGFLHRLYLGAVYWGPGYWLLFCVFKIDGRK